MIESPAMTRQKLPNLMVLILSVGCRPSIETTPVDDASPRFPRISSDTKPTCESKETAKMIEDVNGEKEN